MVTFPNFKRIFNAIDGEPECEIYFKDTDITYMIIKYDGYVSFQRCGYVVEGSGEFKYRSLDDLYHSVLVDGISLKKDWDKIETIVIDSAFDLADDDQIELLKQWYELKI